MQENRVALRLPGRSLRPQLVPVPPKRSEVNDYGADGPEPPIAGHVPKVLVIVRTADEDALPRPCFNELAGGKVSSAPRYSTSQLSNRGRTPVVRQVAHQLLNLVTTDSFPVVELIVGKAETASLQRQHRVAVNWARAPVSALIRLLVGHGTLRDWYAALAPPSGRSG